MVMFQREHDLKGSLFYFVIRGFERFCHAHLEATFRQLRKVRRDPPRLVGFDPNQSSG
jgi:hypothetical protein